MTLNEKQRRQVLEMLKKAAILNLYNTEQKQLINLFEDPISLNVCYNPRKRIFVQEGRPLELKYLKMLARGGELFFDFTHNIEEDKRFYEERGDEWKDDYAYNRITSVEIDASARWNNGADDEEMYLILEDGEGMVDTCRFDIREVIYVDDKHIDVIDRGMHEGQKRRICIRPRR